MSEIVWIVITAVVTSGLATTFSYYKEKKFASSKYTQKVLEKLYIPIYKILEESNHRIRGYLGMNFDQFNEIKLIIKENPELCDPKLERLINTTEEDFYRTYTEFSKSEEYDKEFNFEAEFYIDQKKVFKNYVLHAFNRTRKSLGLPSDYFYVYPFLFKMRNMRYSIRSIKRKWKWKYRRAISKIKSRK